MISLKRAFEKSYILGKSDLLLAAFNAELKDGEKSSETLNFEIQAKRNSFSYPTARITPGMIEAFEKAIKEG